MTSQSQFTTFVAWCKTLIESPNFDQFERDYKLALGTDFGLVASDGLHASAIVEWLRSPSNNFMTWRDNVMIGELSDESLSSETALLLGPGELRARVDRFSDWLKGSSKLGPGVRTTTSSTLLMGSDPRRYPPYRTRPIKEAMALAGREASSGSPGDRYLQFLDFCDEVLESISQDGARTPDRLDIQGAMWVIGATTPEQVQQLIPDRHAEFEAWRSDGEWVGERSGRLWVVYVGQKSMTNFHHSLPQGTWGWKDHRPDYDGIRPGDLLLLGAEFDGGSPRVPHDEFAKHSMGRVVVGRLESAVFEDSTPFWPDENGIISYPHRVRFEIQDDSGPIPLRELDEQFGGGVSEALRLSANSQGGAKLVNISNSVPVGAEISTAVTPESFDAVVAAFSSASRTSGLDYGSLHDVLIRSFVTALAAKPFVILTGLSGSGKTRLAQAFGHWLGAAKVVAVRPDWTSPDALFGFENTLSELVDGRHAWNVPETLRFILEASEMPDQPHLLLLDEMNLAHVERYFADVLSGMESGEPVVPDLVRDRTGTFRSRSDSNGFIPLPRNLFVVGTVNVDETTYMFSPKVLDRANTFEVRVDTSDLTIRPAPRMLTATDPAFGSGFLRAALDPNVEPDEQFAAWLRNIHQILARANREFGHRTFLEALRFNSLFAEAGGADPMVALDLQVAQKVLPRLHGTRREMNDLLNELGAYCRFGPHGDSPEELECADHPPDEDTVLPLSYSKLHRMALRLRDNHFVSFAE